MLAARMALFTATPAGCFSRLAPRPRPDQIRLMANEARTGVRPTHAARRRTLKEIAMAPAGGSAFR